MAALGLPKGILWNTRDNTAYEIEIPDRTAFLDAATRAVTKGMIKKYYGSRAVREIPGNVKNESHTEKAEKKKKFWFQFWK